ncbi:helix-turn-helix transcriptional regulator [Caenispirillum bisanense]|uniref:LuxR family transcriptional regulator, quorum sensing-dependent transcriptional regulator n=1 Tax=Caenispirillum bisanense TaxID=414052 RepID=A0A286G5D1_9PROT|nr:LuxR family transcriptional regulator [Caenispirillum bisanense]SOD90703.1 LuxR family transcriptional regulator, quorum sensing-dependent transcriptional regulator [Caenispirillum bisanense]
MPPRRPRAAVLPPDWMSRIADTATMDDLGAVSATLVEGLGFRMPTYGLFLGAAGMPAPAGLFTTFPAAWVEHYLATEAAAVDPVVHHAHGTRDPFTWSEIPAARIGPAEAEHLRRAADFGIVDGLTVPLATSNAIGVFTALADGSRAERAAALRMRRDGIAALAMAVHDRAIRLCRSARLPAAPTLSPRERECLQWLVVGKSGSEIGEILGISDLTVTQHLKSAMRKLGVYNRVHLAVRAVALGLVAPE